MCLRRASDKGHYEPFHTYVVDTVLCPFIAILACNISGSTISPRNRITIDSGEEEKNTLDSETELEIVFLRIYLHAPRGGVPLRPAFDNNMKSQNVFLKAKFGA